MKRGLYYTPIVTALNQDGSIDWEGNANVIEHLIHDGKGVDGLLFMGSTGDFYSFTAEQKKEMMRFAVKTVNKRVKVLFGTGGMNMEETIDLTNYSVEAGVDGCLVINHYYFTQPEASVEHFYATIAERCPHATLYFYSYPDRTGTLLNPKMVARLAAKYKNYVGIKNSVALTQNTREIIAEVTAVRPDFQVFVGYDEHFVWNMFSGGAGAMGAISNIAPCMCHDWADALYNKDYDKIEEIQKKINLLNRLFVIDTLPNHLVKRALQVLGVKINDYVPEPFLPITPEQEAQVIDVMKKCDLL